MRKDKVKPKKVQLAEQSKAALSESKLAKMWAEQVTTKTQPVGTNSRGLKRKLFNLEGSVRKAGRVDTICVCPCVCSFLRGVFSLCFGLKVVDKFGDFLFLAELRRKAFSMQSSLFKMLH